MVNTAGRQPIVWSIVLMGSQPILSVALDLSAHVLFFRVDHMFLVHVDIAGMQRLVNESTKTFVIYL